MAASKKVKTLPYSAIAAIQELTNQCADSIQALFKKSELVHITMAVDVLMVDGKHFAETIMLVDMPEQTKRKLEKDLAIIRAKELLKRKGIQDGH